MANRERYRALGSGDLDEIPQLSGLSVEERLAMKAVSAVLPFRVNGYVLDELIDWQNIPDDPMYQLTFPQRDMLAREDFARMVDLVRSGAPRDVLARVAREIQHRMNPQPAGQIELNVPSIRGDPLPGMQHKYRETVLFFPAQGQTCHAYCSYCFRWAQFVGIDELKFQSRATDRLVAYLREHREVSSVLITGGDPLIMRTSVLERCLLPLLGPGLEHITSIRIGTKATAYWPFRFLDDPDADDLLRLFERVRDSGKHLAIMAHYSHPRELETRAAQAAVRRILSTGVVIRCQSPIVRHVNDDAGVWADLWRLEVQLGTVPYYMFIERDTGPKGYFEVPLVRAAEVFREAVGRVSGLARTVRGPSMSATAGKVVVRGVAELHDERVFVLEFLQARNPEWIGRPFFASYDAAAVWLDQLRPARGDGAFFFEEELAAIRRNRRAPPWGERVPPRRPSVIFGNVEWE